MRAVRAHHEKKLEQQFVRVGVALIRVIPEVPITVLRTDLTELAWPVGENTGKAGVRQVSVGGLAQIAVRPQVADDAHVLATVRTEQFTGIAPKDLCRPLCEPILRRRQESLNGNSSIIDAVFAADEIVCCERAVNVRQSVIV